jgi:hypothetical protein
VHLLLDFLTQTENYEYIFTTLRQELAKLALEDNFMRVLLQFIALNRVTVIPHKNLEEILQKTL